MSSSRLQVGPRRQSKAAIAGHAELRFIADAGRDPGFEGLPLAVSLPSTESSHRDPYQPPPPKPRFVGHVLAPEEQRSVIARARSIQRELGATRLQSAVLALRGHDRDSARRFLHPDLEGEIHRLGEIAGMSDAAKTVRRAIELNQSVALYGDFDADGNCSLAVLARTLRHFRVPFTVIQPDRIQHGYGLHTSLLNDAKAFGAELLITADLGSSQPDELRYAKEVLGLTTLVIDHHQMTARCAGVQQFAQIVNPQLPGSFEAAQDLCATALAWLFVRELRHELSCSSDTPLRMAAEAFDPMALLPYVAIATIADQTPLRNVNRAVVATGLPLLDSSEHVGIQALLEVARRHHSRADSDFIGFRIGPTINACGRILDMFDGQPGTRPVMELLITEDRNFARECARFLSKVNERRKGIELEATSLARSQVLNRLQDGADITNGLVVVLPSGHQGVIGLVASRLMNEFHCPVVVLLDGQGPSLKGSARSIEGIDVTRCLMKFEGSLERVGGHAMAAGLTIGRENVARFRRELEAEFAKEMRRIGGWRPYRADLELTVGFIARHGRRLIKELDALQPVGKDSPEARIIIRRARAVSARRWGGSHIMLELQDDLPGFNADRMPALLFHTPNEALVRPPITGFNGEQYWVPHRESVSLIATLKLGLDNQPILQILEAQRADLSESGYGVKPRGTRALPIVTRSLPSLSEPGPFDEPSEPPPPPPDLSAIAEKKNHQPTAHYLSQRDLFDPPEGEILRSWDELCREFSITTLRYEELRPNQLQIQLITAILRLWRQAEDSNEPPPAVAYLSGTGTGKSIIALVLAHAVISAEKKALFITPKQGDTKQFGRQATRFAHEGEALTGEVHGDNLAQRKRKIPAEKQLLFGTPASVVNDYLHGRLRLEEYDLLVFDEAHHDRGDDSFAVLIDILNDARRRGDYCPRVVFQSATLHYHTEIVGKRLSQFNGIRPIRVNIAQGKITRLEKRIAFPKRWENRLCFMDQTGGALIAAIDAGIEKLRTIAGDEEPDTLPSSLPSQLSLYQVKFLKSVRPRDKSGQSQIPSAGDFVSLLEEFYAIRNGWERRAREMRKTISKDAHSALNMLSSCMAELGHFRHLYSSLFFSNRFSAARFIAETAWDSLYPEDRDRVKHKYRPSGQSAMWISRLYRRPETRAVVADIVRGTPYEELVRHFYDVIDKRATPRSKNYWVTGPATERRDIAPKRRYLTHAATEYQRIAVEAGGGEDDDPFHHPKEEALVRDIAALDRAAQRKSLPLPTILVRTDDAVYARYLTTLLNEKLRDREAIFIAGKKHLSSKRFNSRITRFLKERGLVAVCTSVTDEAVDLPDVGAVFLLQPPTAEQDTQVSGRGGRGEGTRGEVYVYTMIRSDGVLTTDQQRSFAGRSKKRSAEKKARQMMQFGLSNSRES